VHQFLPRDKTDLPGWEYAIDESIMSIEDAFDSEANKL